MTSKIFRSTILVAAVVLLSSLATVMGMLFSHFSGVQLQQLTDELSIAAAGTEEFGLSFLKKLDSSRFRVTWIGADGTVLYDTRVAASEMESHANRQEFLDAISEGSGSSSRYSDTLLEKTFYEAVRLSDGTVLRISVSRDSAAALMMELLLPVILIAGLAILLSAILAKRMAMGIVEPLNKLDLEHPLRNDTYEEIEPLLRRINSQHLQISRQVQTLQQKNDEFLQITENMQEGLVVLNSEGCVLSINPTACRLFEANSDCVGKNFLQIDRSREMRDAVNKALDSGYSVSRIHRSGREYRMDLSRISSEGTVIGAVLLAIDITDSLNAERTRREFSANVSHELKTPLQTIIGSAELLENGLVKPEDAPRFVGHIRKEAKRLVDLVEDIIRLSQLDEGVPLPKEEVELLALAREVAASLSESARAAQVAVSVEGESCTVAGVRRLLSEILFNLCDNAIKYNVPGGRVHVRVRNVDGKGELQVSDTGIGIPEEHQSRIFERFYRVDKSHSKQSGGTGLGMSIVKHAVQYHNAQLSLESQPGEGTTVTVKF